MIFIKDSATRRALFFTIFVFLLIVSSIPTVKANGVGWLSGWDYRVKITIDADDIDTILTDFPILIYISDSSGVDNENVSFVFDEVGANSLKIAVTLSDGITECYVEVEKWDLGNRQAWLWTKIDSIDNIVDTDIYLYYDKDHADNNEKVGVVASISGKAVWDTNFLSVLHFSESSGNFLSSCLGANDATSQGDSVIRGTERIDGGISLGGTNDYARIENVAIINNLDEYTVEVIVKGDAYTVDRAVAGNWAGPQNQVFLIYYDQAPNNRWRILFLKDGGGVYDVVFGAIPPIVGTWYFLAGTFKRDDFVYGYQDGVQTQGDPTANVQSEDTDTKIAIGEEMAGGGKDFNAHFDEFRISDIARSSSWIKGSYESGIDDLLDFGEEEERTPLEEPFKLFGAGFNVSIPHVDLYWESNLTDITLFEVQNSTDKIIWEYLGANTTTEYHDFQVVDGTERYYKVRACNFTFGSWDNSTFTDIDFEIVYFIEGEGIESVNISPSIIMAIFLILVASGLIYGVRKRR